MPFKCCVPKCIAPKGTMLHSFPADFELLKTWCQVIGRPALIEKGFAVVRKYYKVCDLHFDEDSKFRFHHNRTNLKVGCIPSLKLPITRQATQLLHVTTHSRRTEAQGEQHLQEAGDWNRPSTSTEQHFQEAGDWDRPSTSAQHTASVQEGGEKKKRAKMSPKLLLRKRRNLLLEVNLRKKAQLTPKAAKLYQVAAEYRSIVRRLTYENQSTRDRIKAALRFAESGAGFEHKVNATTFRFLMSQISQQAKKPKGRRFSDEDKLLSLALLKQSPRGYRLWKKIFALPSRKTLMAVLHKVPFDCGLNEAVLDSLKEAVTQLKPRDRHCILMFDEMSLQPLLHYNKAEEYIDGFQALSATNRSLKIADHVTVFMIKGMALKWKQPISYYFSQNGMSQAEMAKNIKQIILKLAELGLQVKATVCDQYNKAAINALVAQTKDDAFKMGNRHETYTFKVGGEEIFPLFDFPHLLKGIRNNMLNYKVRFAWKSGVEVADWSHIEQLYELDSGEDDFRMLNKLTDEHVRKHRIKKMKVKHAAQVFSHRVQSTMRGLLRHGNTYLPPEALGTANFLLFVDKLFDSVNGSAVEPTDGKLLRRAITGTSPHIEFWDEAINVLRSIKFFSEKREFVPPTITNWILSLKNLKLLWSVLQNSQFEFLCPRNLNQDPLENFFSCVRSHGARNINPSCTSFRATFKSLIINNYVTAHSPNANCEEDATEGVLSGLKHFLASEPPSQIECGGFVPLTYGDKCKVHLKPVEGEIVLKVHGYVAGAIAKRILKAIGACEVCRSELKTQVISQEHGLIQDREYKANSLLKPRTKFIVLFGLCNQVLQYYMPKICHEKHLFTKLKLIIAANIDSAIFIKCPSHNLYTIFVEHFIHLFCFTWATNVNRILKGETTIAPSDVIKQQARTLFLKYRKRRDELRKTKQLNNCICRRHILYMA